MHESLFDQIVTDGRETVGRGRHDLHGANHADHLLALVPGECGGFGLFRYSRLLKDLIRYPGCDPGEIIGKECLHRLLNGVLCVFLELSYLHALGVGFDLLGFDRHRVGRPLEHERVALGIDERDLAVRIDDGGVLEILVHRLFSAHVLSGYVVFDVGTMLLPIPDECIVVGYLGAVLLGVDEDIHLACEFTLHHGFHVRGFSGGDVTVHDRGGDSDTLLSSGLPQRVESRTEEETSEYVRDHPGYDTGTVVLYDDLVFLATEIVHSDVYVGQDVRLLAGIEGVVHRLFDTHQEGFGTTVETEDVFVLLEELCDGDLALFLGKILGYRLLLSFLFNNIVCCRGHPCS